MKSVKINNRSVISSECFEDLLDNLLTFDSLHDVLGRSNTPHLIAYSDYFEMSLYANVYMSGDNLEIGGLYASHDGVNFGVSYEQLSKFQEMFAEINSQCLADYLEESVYV